MSFLWLLHLNCKFAVVLIGGAVYLLCAADGEDAPANDDLLCAPAAARRESQVRESQVREWFMCFFRCCPAARWCAHVLQYACGDGFINGARDVLQVGGGRLDWVRAAVYDCARFAGVAQLVEQRIRNAQVMGSSPFTGSRHFSFIFSPRLLAGFFYRHGVVFVFFCDGLRKISHQNTQNPHKVL